MSNTSGWTKSNVPCKRCGEMLYTRIISTGSAETRRPVRVDRQSRCFNTECPAGRL